MRLIVMYFDGLWLGSQVVLEMYAYDLYFRERGAKPKIVFLILRFQRRFIYIVNIRISLWPVAFDNADVDLRHGNDGMDR